MTHFLVKFFFSHKSSKKGSLDYPVPGSRPSYPAPGPRSHKSFNQLNLLLGKVQSLWSCAHYFQWFAGYLNHVILPMSQVHDLKKLFFNVHLSCFMDFILCPTDKYMFKVTIKKIRLLCICSSLKINTACYRSFVFIVDFDHSQYINIVFLLWTLNKYLLIGCERQVIMFWKPYFIQQFIIAPNWYKLRLH